MISEDRALERTGPHLILMATIAKFRFPDYEKKLDHRTGGVHPQKDLETSLLRPAAERVLWRLRLDLHVEKTDEILSRLGSDWWDVLIIRCRDWRFPELGDCGILLRWQGEVAERIGLLVFAGRDMGGQTSAMPCPTPPEEKQIILG